MKITIGRRFIVRRTVDISKVSGVGCVAEGIQLHDGQVVVSWFGKHHVFEVPRDLETWLAVHGHGGTTTIQWIDQKSTFDL